VPTVPRSLFLRLVVGDRWWLRNPPQKMRERRRCRRGAARRGRSRASVPAARSRAVNFELVRDATAYVCPECGTKCATDRTREGSKTERERGARVARAPERSFLSCCLARGARPPLSRQRSGSSIPPAASVEGRRALRRVRAMHFR